MVVVVCWWGLARAWSHQLIRGAGKQAGHVERISGLVMLGTSSPLRLIDWSWGWTRILSWLELLDLGVGVGSVLTSKRLDKTDGEV